MPVNLDALNPRQREAAAHPGGPLLILAGAGTGKTRVITYRVARLIETGVSPERILAVTFTNKAADEMRRRIDELSPGAGALVWAHTFHAFACRLLRRHHELLKIPKHFTIYDQADQKKLVTDCMKELGLEEQTAKAGLFVTLISRAKDDLLDAQSYAIYAAAGADAARQTAARIYALYQKRLEAAGALDFGDLLLKTCTLIKEHQSVRELYQEQFQHLLVDEYQDTNHAQYSLTKTLAAKHRNLCVVGDDDQSVYSWRGANIRNILEFERDFKDASVVVLDQNYRSTPVILEAAGRVIRNNKARKIKNLWTEKSGGDGVYVQELSNESEEASWVARRAQELFAAGRRPKDMAVFYRTNAQSRSFEEALRRAVIPYRIVGAVRFYERKEVKDALAYARVLLNPADAASLIRILNVPPRGIGKTSLERLETWSRSTGVSLWEAFERQAEIPQLTPACRKAVQDLLVMLNRLKDALPQMSAAGVLARILEDSGYWASLEKETEVDPEAAGRLNNLQELLNAVKEHEDRARRKGVPAELGSFLEEVSLHSDLDGMEEREDVLTLMTVHLSKGLEFPVVFLTGLEEGLFPISAGNASPEELEEERRLCYVGITRARERLFLSHAATRRMFGQVYANLPSRFILEAQLTGSVAAPAPSFSAPRGPGAIPGVAPAPAAPSRRLDKVRVGMRVRHPSFGAGQVLAQSGSGEAAKVTVRFDDGRTTKLLVRYAPLEPA